METLAISLTFALLTSWCPSSHGDIAPEQPPAVAEIPALAAKPPRQAKPPVLKNIISKKSFMWVRSVETNRDAGIMSAQMGIVSPLQTYILTSYSFQTTGSSKNRSDYHAFSESTYFFTPSLYNVGLVGNHSSNSSTQRAIMRGGLYLRVAGGTKWNSFGLYPMFLINDSNGKSFRTVMLFIVNLFKGDLILDGSVGYAVRAGISSSTFDPTISARIYDNLRFATGYSFAKNGAVAADNIYAGIEFRRYF